MSEGPQTFDIAVTSLTYYGTTKPPTSLNSFYYPGRDVTTAAWRTSANTRIESIRKGDLNVKVVDANNNPIPGTLSPEHEHDDNASDDGVMCVRVCVCVCGRRDGAR
jgi:hypothetical protein